MKWNILNKAKNSKDAMKNILKYKNMTKEQILNFINFNISINNPFSLTNMDKAINRIISAINNKETITIIGDYDVDGICSTMVMYLTLKDLTKTLYIIPDRFKNGYGISNDLINMAKENNTNLIITVDNGIKAHEQVKYANLLGIDVLISDHHAFEDDLLPTPITINPQIDNNYPFKDICGCMVAFKICQALKYTIKEQQLNNTLNGECKELYANNLLNNELNDELIIFVCLATIADVMPLINENRFYVNKGLKLINNKNTNIGLKELIKELNINNVTSNDIGFYIAPCINAAGRLESPNLVMDLLLNEDFVECNKQAKYLIDLNNKRKDIQKQILNNLVVNEDDNFIIAKIDDNLSGIAGIIAGNVVEKYRKPCFCISENNKSNILHGSGRSLGNYPINQIVENNDFLSGGGHKQACGLKLESQYLDKLKDVCNKDYLKYLENNQDTNIESIDIINEINFNIITDKLINNINKLQPFGYGNEQPLFCTKNVEIICSKIVGKNKNVIQFELKQSNKIIKAIGFMNIINKFMKLNKNKIDIIYSMNFNEYPKNVFTIQLLIKDIK